MDTTDKANIKLTLGRALTAILQANKNNAEAISSLRKLAANSGIEYAIIQKIASGAKDPQFTTLVTIAEGLEMKLSEVITEFEILLEESKISAKSKPGKKHQ